MPSPYTLTTGADGYYQKKSAEFTVLSKTVDFAKFTGSTYGVAGDIAKIITIPANFQVQSVSVVVVTASTTSSATITVEDNAALDYVAGFAVTGTTPSTGGTPKLYPSETTMNVLLGATAPLDGIVTVHVTGFQC